jgi:hypothetical protein
MINFSIGGFYLKSKELFFILEALKKNNNLWLKDSFKIGSVFGSFPNAIWSGGRTTIGHPWSIDKIKETIDYYNSQNIGIRYTFTNSLIEEKHLNDYYCNLLLELAHDGMNGVIVNSEVLFNYIKKNFPNFEFISSITKPIQAVEEIITYQKNNDLLVPPVTLVKKHGNKLFQFVDNSKIEILVNEVCLVSNCPFKDEHYEVESLRNLNYDPNIQSGFCSDKFSKKPFANKHEVHVDPDEIIELNEKYKISNFKFSGRAQPSGRFFEEFAQFLIKDEYKIDFYNSILYYFDVRDSITPYKNNNTVTPKFNLNLIEK